MISISRTLVTGFVLAAQVAVAQTVEQSQLALLNATVVDVESGRQVPNQTIVVRGDRIVAVGNASIAPVPTGALKIDLHGAWVIPGLWDMHVHIGAWDAEPGLASGLADYYGSLFLAHGVTGVRDLGGNLAVLRALDSLGRTQTAAMPRLAYTGEKLGRLPVLPGAPGTVRSAADVRLSIQALKHAGVSYVKLAPTLPVPLFQVALQECAAAGLRCVSHIPAADTSVWLSGAGRGSYEHLFNLGEQVSSLPADRLFALRDEYARPGLMQRVLYKASARERPREPNDLVATTRDTTRDQRFFASLAQAGSWVTPTLLMHQGMTRTGAAPPAVFDPRWTLTTEFPEPDTRTPVQHNRARKTWRMWLGLVGAMSRAGVNLLAGTDFSTGYVPGASLHAELWLLQSAGLGPAAVLRSATLNPGRYFGGDTLGLVAPGRVADLVVLRRNPLEDIRHVAEIEMVVARGHLVRRAALDQLTARAALAADRLRAMPLDAGPAGR